MYRRQDKTRQNLCIVTLLNVVYVVYVLVDDDDMFIINLHVIQKERIMIVVIQEIVPTEKFS